VIGEYIYDAPHPMNKTEHYTANQNVFCCCMVLTIDKNADQKTQKTKNADKESGIKHILFKHGLEIFLTTV